MVKEASNTSDDPVEKTIDEVVKLETLQRTMTERLAESVAGFAGSMYFIFLHVIWFGLWVTLNIPWLGFHQFDPYPFTFLTMIVSLEAIFLSTFILMVENRQTRLADRRARVNLQIDMISEREVTKLMQLVLQIHEHLGIRRHGDSELANMQKATNIEHLSEAAQSLDNKNSAN